jgi:hypothetical protein
VSDSIAAAAAKGHLDALRAMRDKLAADMDAAEPAVVAQIAGRLQAVLDRIAELEGQQPSKESPLDELLARRSSKSTADPVRQPKRRASAKSRGSSVAP